MKRLLQKEIIRHQDPCLLKWADQGGQADQDGGAKRKLPRVHLLLVRYCRQNVVRQDVAAAAHRVLYERARVRLTAVPFEVDRRTGLFEGCCELLGVVDRRAGVSVAV